MLSFKTPALFRLTERLSFKKLKEVNDDEDFASFDSMHGSPDPFYEAGWTKKYTTPASPTLSFSEYNGGAKLSRKSRRHPSLEQDQLQQRQYYDLEYNADGTENTYATAANVQARTSKMKRRLSIMIVIDDTLDKIKYTLSPTEKTEAKKKARFSHAGKVNADVRIQFDGEKFIYRV
jgi:hypothetical protein